MFNLGWSNSYSYSLILSSIFVWISEKSSTFVVGFDSLFNSCFGLKFSAFTSDVFFNMFSSLFSVSGDWKILFTSPGLIKLKVFYGCFGCFVRGSIIFWELVSLVSSKICSLDCTGFVLGIKDVFAISLMFEFEIFWKRFNHWSYVSFGEVDCGSDSVMFMDVCSFDSFWTLSVSMFTFCVFWLTCLSYSSSKTIIFGSH